MTPAPTRCRSGRAPGRAAHPRRARAGPRGRPPRSPTTRWRRPTRPPHWLPPEAWVYNHWIPYDEGRLYALLHITREQLWQQLRDDHRNVAQLAARHGWRDPGRLADALVAPWRGHVRRGARRRAARPRAAHDHAGAPVPAPVLPLAAPVRDPVARAADLRPQRRGLPRRAAHARAQPADHRPPARALAGAGGGAERRGAARARPRRRGRPRDHQRARRGSCCAARSRSSRAGSGRRATTGRPRRTTACSSPSRTTTPPTRRSRPTARTSSTSSTARSCRWRCAWARSPSSRATCAAGATRSSAARRRRAPNQPLDPRSAYNATVSGDGRLVAYESSPGNVNFAKRYGRIGVPPGRRRATGARRASTTRRAARTSRSRPTTRSWPPTGATSPSRPFAARGRRRSSSATCTPARGRWPAAACRARRAGPSPRSTSRGCRPTGASSPSPR